ncbi:MAG TPA: hypothetical protein PKK54_01005 [bacterium]|jgi:uncharacterized protein YpmB|nr:hypothetical protein [bacterium]
MNNSESAKKGFKTFILTLSISLMIFSAVYYLLSSYKPENNIDSGDISIVVKEAGSVSGSKDASAYNIQEEQPVVQGVQDERNEDTIFGKIAGKKPAASPKIISEEVLAGATSTGETTQSTSPVPATGYIEMTLGLFFALAVFIAAMIYNAKNPRSVAISSFEKNILKKSK